MFDKWLNLPAHYYLHLTALSLLMVGLPLSNVVMSVGTIWIIANWLIEGNFKTKWIRFKGNKPLIAISILFIWLFISFAWSSNLQYGIKDLANKLPFVVIPLVVGTREPIKQKNYTFLLYLFLVSLTVTTIINFFYYKNSPLKDIRQMSMFISHIRLGMLLCLGIFLAFYEVIKKRMKAFIVLPILVWLLYYLYLSQVLIAYLIFVVLLYVSVIYFIKSKKIKLIVILTTIGLFLVLIFKVNQTIKNFHQPISINFDTLETYTVNGNKYFHNKESGFKENGQLVMIYVCEKELRKEWSKASDVDFDANDKQVFANLTRYMTSKGLKKDSLGFSKLTKEDIVKIENGKTNDYRGIKSKLNKLYVDLFTITGHGNPNGHSFYQRIEHFKTGLHILYKNWLFGVGIGDVQQAFDKQYIIDQSMLNINNRHRAHNQILTLWLSTGIVGFLLIIYILFYPFFTKTIIYPLLITNITLIIGFLTQDLIESQAGVTLFAVFYSLFVLSKPFNKA
jgi:hypothetical protein